MSSQGGVPETQLERQSRRFGHTGGWFLAVDLSVGVPGNRADRAWSFLGVCARPGPCSDCTRAVDRCRRLAALKRRCAPGGPPSAVCIASARCVCPLHRLNESHLRMREVESGTCALQTRMGGVGGQQNPLDEALSSS